MKLRAAIANTVPEFVKSEIIESIRKDNLDVQISNDGSVTLVGHDYALTKKIEELVQARAAARAAKNWRESDRIRDELAAMGVVLKDSKEGTTWEIAR